MIFPRQLCALLRLGIGGVRHDTGELHDALAGGVQGMFLDTKLSWPMRIVTLACALCMIISGTVTDLIGLVLLVGIVVYVKFFAKRQPTLA